MIFHCPLSCVRIRCRSIFHCPLSCVRIPSTRIFHCPLFCVRIPFRRIFHFPLSCVGIPNRRAFHCPLSALSAVYSLTWQISTNVSCRHRHFLQSIIRHVGPRKRPETPPFGLHSRTLFSFCSCVTVFYCMWPASVWPTLWDEVSNNLTPTRKILTGKRVYIYKQLNWWVVRSRRQRSCLAKNLATCWGLHVRATDTKTRTGKVVKMGGASYFLPCKTGIRVLNKSQIMKRFDKGGKDSCTV